MAGPRRQLLVASSLSFGAVLAPVTALAGGQELGRRFAGSVLDKLPSGFIAPWGPRDLYYPRWMEGRWHVRAVLSNYSAPLGVKFVSSRSSDIRMAQQTLAEQQKRLGDQVEYDLQYLMTQSQHVAEDRRFNAAARLNAYAGRPVVRRVEYADVPGSTREEAVKNGDGPSDPLLTTLVYLKGAVQKVFVTGFESEEGPGGDLWRGSQSIRQLLAAPGAGYNPFAVDEEVLTEYRRRSDGIVMGRVRLLGYLNPTDPLFFEAGNKAVTVADYTLELSPVLATELASSEAASAV